MQNLAQHVALGALVKALTGAQLRRHKLQHASQLQFAEQLFRRSSEPSNVNGFHVLKRDPGLTIEFSAPILLCRERRSAGEISSVDIRIRPLFRVSHRRQAILRQSVGRARHLRRFFGLLHLIVI